MDILFKEGSERKVKKLPEETLKDLAVSELIRSIGTNQDEKTVLNEIFSQIPLDPEDIRFRQGVFKDLMNDKELCDALYSSLTKIKIMKEYAGAKRAVSDKDNALYTLLNDLRSLSTYVDTVSELSEELSKHDLSSKGLISLREELNKITGTDEFENTKKDIALMLEDLSNVKGAIIGVNFTPDLTIEEVAAIEFIPYHTRSKYTFAELAAKIGILTNAGQMAQRTDMNSLMNLKINDPLLASMCPKIEKHLKRHFGNIKSVMAKYSRMDGRLITDMYEGLTFYLACARFTEKLKNKGYVFCIPSIEDTDELSFRVKDFYNIRLALLGETDIVTNDFHFTPEEKIFILTGPNRGGKTILEQGLGLVSLMASLGLFVTASEFRGLPFKNILTHFPIDENLTINYGRLGEEAVRIRSIVKDSDAYTLVLFNETYSTTSSTDALYLSQDLLHILKDKSVSVIFNTHIHELARDLSATKDWGGPDRIVSLIMEIKDNVNTFKVKESEPDVSSYARNIALKYGVTYEQMKQEDNWDL